ncbi:hypothetical protein R6Q59_019991 [Mikania micrantha]|uniref:DUF538 domain-containing protein n=1 Tax=Mikania micrantha TaxID=192012 RepID=A0A5N6PT80_9ASTR|nr:hypothetical protein E3N88_07035 [Mikania micrantha]
MASQLIESHRENAEIYTGEALCKAKSRELLAKFSLPKGLIPLADVSEVGYNASTGFVWVRRMKKIDHIFRAIGRKVSYGCEVTAFVEDRRMRNLTGVKSKELLIWVTISDIRLSESGKITFGTPAGLSRTFPATAFEEED